jgi:hypothetical protein
VNQALTADEFRTNCSVDARRGFDRFTAGCFLLGAWLLAAAGAADPATGSGLALGLLAGGAATAGAAALVYAFRFLAPAWRPVRTDPFGRFLAYALLLALPCVATSRAPWLSAAVAAGLLMGLLSYYALKEAFTADASGFLSQQTLLWGLAIGAWILMLGRVGLDRAGAFGEAVVDYPPFAPRDLPPGAGQGFAQLYGSMLLVPLPTLAAMALSDSGRRRRWLWAVTALAVVAGVALSFSRAAWLALAAQVAALALLRWRQGGGWILAATAVAGVVALIAVPGLLPRLATLFDTGHATNIQRMQQWRVALDLLAESPFTGHGWGSFGALYAARAGVFYHWPHNLPLHIAVEGGVPALAVFAAWVMELVGVVRRDYGAGSEARQRAAFRDAAVATVVGLLVFGLFDW